MDGLVRRVSARDGGGDLLAGDVGELTIEQLGRVCVALADQVVIEPLPGDRLQLSEQMELRLVAGVAPLRVQQMACEVKEDGRLPQVARVLERQVDALSDDADVQGVRGTDHARIESEGRAVVVLLVKSGDVVIDELRGRGVVADDDEAGRRADACARPELEGLLVMAVQRFERCLELAGELERIESTGLPSPLLRHVLADVLPEIAEHGRVFAGDVVGHRNARQLDDAGFDGVHEREVAHGPGEECALRVARAAEKERCGGEIEHALQSDLAVDAFEASDPQSGRLVVVDGLLFLVALEILVLLGAWLGAISSGEPRR